MAAGGAPNVWTSARRRALVNVQRQDTLIETLCRNIGSLSSRAVPERTLLKTLLGKERVRDRNCEPDSSVGAAPDFAARHDFSQLGRGDRAVLAFSVRNTADVRLRDVRPFPSLPGPFVAVWRRLMASDKFGDDDNSFAPGVKRQLLLYFPLDSLMRRGQPAAPKLSVVLAYTREGCRRLRHHLLPVVSGHPRALSVPTLAKDDHILAAASVLPRNTILLYTDAAELEQRLIGSLGYTRLGQAFFLHSTLLPYAVLAVRPGKEKKHCSLEIYAAVKQANYFLSSLFSCLDSSYAKNIVFRGAPPGFRHEAASVRQEAAQIRALSRELDELCQSLQNTLSRECREDTPAKKRRFEGFQVPSSAYSSLRRTLLQLELQTDALLLP